jgi:hypothetical protein
VDARVADAAGSEKKPRAASRSHYCRRELLGAYGSVRARDWQTTENSSAPALAALAIVVACAVAGFAMYTFGWHNRGGTRATLGVSVATVKDVAGTDRVCTVREGDVVLLPTA